ncbi:formyltetrahydrofolate deformylase [Pullulanibacillus pueri]|uniref:Formyltetrahydrofolate deformylase n=1 Tax=Pullulanibacillus pueri TaxID=1437324 RepID=A0A8J3EPD8_9BACL|nr:formyltetrahydrofolate deformylase [Pullulanibacillus pueri]MBM7684051.1 formyltetrahydrofolate deformylase [Pullulanibacillus pueri]GGH88456.1 formyltetrahydrofolate deformylase [Pullulanibacillus pueri]
MTSYIQTKLEAFKKERENRGRLLISCPDQPGIVAAVSNFLFHYKANIIESSQYSTNPEGGTFFIRIEFECPSLNTLQDELKEEFQPLADQFSMAWTLTCVSELKKLALFVSKEPHCLREILWEWQSGDLMAEIALVVSNHEEARDIVEDLGIPFYYIPASKENRADVEHQQIQLLKEFEVDVIILARYMQILTSTFVSEFPHQIINIHHSFLPAFVGARPYHRAYQRGVKLIGATSHYVTDDLDEGPIIEQDIMRVDHRDHVEDLKKIGRNIERSVLARAVKWHLEDRIIVHDNKTIVF